MDILGQDSLNLKRQTNSIQTQMTESESPDWATLLNRVAEKRDKAAYTRLFNYFAPRLKSFGLKLLKQEALALEMVQETMLNVWLKAHLFNPDKGAASTWIYTIARNVRYDILRKISSKKEDNIAEELWPVIVESDAQESEFTELENLLLQGQLDNFYQFVPERQLEVIQLVYLDEKSHQEVSELLEIPLGTVKSRIRLGLIKLQQAMEQKV